MHISNLFVIVCNIQIVIRMLYHGFETLLMVKSGKSFVKIGSCLQIAFLFLFYRNSQAPRLFRPPSLPAYLTLPNVPTSPLIRSLSVY